MNIPDHITESLQIIVWVKNTKILGCESGSWIGDGKNRIRDPGSASRIRTTAKTVP
jgi:hypothetical protein